MRKLILEAAHSYMTYMSIVPNAKLLKWADVLLHIDPVISKDGIEREQAVHLLERELKHMVYEPIYAIANSIRMQLGRVQTADGYKEINVTITKACDSAMKDMLNPDSDVIQIKAQLVAAINECFRWLNKVQGFRYPEIQLGVEMLDGRIH